jgi:hypothetical protein
MNLWKSRPKCVPKDFFVKLIQIHIIGTKEKSSQHLRFFDTFEHNRPIGENSPNLGWFLKYFRQKIGVFAQNKAKLCKNWIVTLVFEKKRHFFAENWQISPKIVIIITSTPGHPVNQSSDEWYLLFLLFASTFLQTTRCRAFSSR